MRAMDFLSPAHRWEPGCEYLVLWSEVPFTDRYGPEGDRFPPVQSDGAHSLGDGGAANARSLIKGMHARDRVNPYADDAVHGFWLASVWDIAGEGTYAAGEIDVPLDTLTDVGSPGQVRWYAVTRDAEPASVPAPTRWEWVSGSRELDAVRDHFAAAGDDGQWAFAVRIERLED